MRTVGIGKGGDAVGTPCENCRWFTDKKDPCRRDDRWNCPDYRPGDSGTDALAAAIEDADRNADPFEKEGHHDHP